MTLIFLFNNYWLYIDSRKPVADIIEDCKAQMGWFDHSEVNHCRKPVSYFVLTEGACRPSCLEIKRCEWKHGNAFIDSFSSKYPCAVVLIWWCGGGGDPSVHFPPYTMKKLVIFFKIKGCGWSTWCTVLWTYENVAKAASKKLLPSSTGRVGLPSHVTRLFFLCQSVKTWNLLPAHIFPPYYDTGFFTRGVSLGCHTEGHQAALAALALSMVALTLRSYSNFPSGRVESVTLLCIKPTDLQALKNKVIKTAKLYNNVFIWRRI